MTNDKQDKFLIINKCELDTCGIDLNKAMETYEIADIDEYYADEPFNALWDSLKYKEETIQLPSIKGDTFEMKVKTADLGKAGKWFIDAGELDLYATEILITEYEYFIENEFEGTEIERRWHENHLGYIASVHDFKGKIRSGGSIEYPDWECLEITDVNERYPKEGRYYYHLDYHPNYVLDNNSDTFCHCIVQTNDPFFDKHAHPRHVSKMICDKYPELFYLYWQMHLFEGDGDLEAATNPKTREEEMFAEQVEHDYCYLGDGYFESRHAWIDFWERESEMTTLPTDYTVVRETKDAMVIKFSVKIILRDGGIHEDEATIRVLKAFIQGEQIDKGAWIDQYVRMKEYFGKKLEVRNIHTIETK